MAMTPQALVRSTEHLLSLPDAALRINQLIDRPSTRPEDLAEVILCDPALSARLLRLVNSAYYSRPRPIDTVSQAIQLIGFDALRNLVIATHAVDMFKGLPPDKINMERFWFHGVACGIAARELALHKYIPDGERLFIAGLLHALGKLMFFSQQATVYLQVLKLIERDGIDVVIAEERVFGFNYADLGAELLRSWRFPDSIWQTVAYHLNPAQAKTYRLETEILHGAAQVASIMQSSTIDVGSALATSVSEMLHQLALSLQLKPQTLAELPAEISERVVDVFNVLIPGSQLTD